MARAEPLPMVLRFLLFLLLCTSLPSAWLRATTEQTKADIFLGFHTDVEDDSNVTKVLKFLNLSNHEKKAGKPLLANTIKYSVAVALGELPAPRFGINVTALNIPQRFNITYVHHQATRGDKAGTLLVLLHFLMHLNTSTVIGTQHSCDTEVKVASALNKPLVTFKCDKEIEEVIKPRTFVRIQPPRWKIAKFIISILKHFKWDKYTLVVSKETKWQLTASTLKRYSKDHQRQILQSFVYGRQARMELWKIIEDSYKSTRIYVFLGNELHLTFFLGFLHKKELIQTGNYAVITHTESNFHNNRMNSFVGDLVYSQQNNHIPEDAFRQTLIVQPRKPLLEAEKDFLNNIIKLLNSSTHDIDTNNPRLSSLHNRNPAYLYDAVMVYLKAIARATLKKNRKGRSVEDVIKNGNLVFESIRNTTFKSILGYDVTIDSNGEAEGNYSIFAYKADNPVPFPSVAWFSSAPNADIPVLHEYKELEHRMAWIKGKPPRAEPECGFDNSKCGLQLEKALPIVASSLSIGILLLVVLLIRHYRYEQKLARLLWKVDYKEILSPDVPAVKDASKIWKTKNRVTEWLTAGLHNRRYEQDTHYSFLLSDGMESERGCGDSDYRHYTLTRSSPKIGSYRGMVVALLSIRGRHIEVTRSVKKEMQLLKEMSHENLNRFIGACLEPNNMYILMEYCSRGSLRDILEKSDLVIDRMFIDSLVFDLIKGMIYLHDSSIGFHGNLKTTKCLVDTRWVLKITGFGLQRLRQSDSTPSNNSSFVRSVYNYDKLLWKAPEHLRSTCPHSSGSAKGDVYSFAIILFEMFDRRGPWGRLAQKHSSGEIVSRVRLAGQPTPFRPSLDDLEEKDFLLDCLRDCWQEDPERRPDFKYIRLQLRPLISGLHMNIFDNMLCIMEKYATRLEWLVDERTRQLSEEKKKIENLLLRMLPKSVTDQLKRGERVVPEQYDYVTIFFSDIVGFTEIAARISPMHIVQLLNDLYTIFDSIIGEYDVYKVETIGDAYMVVSGLPIRNGDHHAGEIASMSLHLLSHIKSFKVPYGPNETLRLRIGIHSGPCAAAVVGLKMPRYCLFGDTVNTASRMESTGVALKIHVSHPCKLILDKLGGYRLEERGLTEIKGKGPMLTYFLLDEDKTSRLRRISAVTPRAGASPSGEIGAIGEDSGASAASDEAFFPMHGDHADHAAFGHSSRASHLSRDMSDTIRKLGRNPRVSLTSEGLPPVIHTNHANGRVRYSCQGGALSSDFFVNHGLDDTDLCSVELLRGEKEADA